MRTCATPGQWRDTSGKRFFLSVLAASLLFAGCGQDRAAPRPVDEPTVGTAPSVSVQAESPQPGGLLPSLQAGGLVIYFRHAATVPGGDTDLQNLANCRTQRNLSDRGREQARAIGDAFRRLQIPVGTVLSSAFCRARETATLAFGRAEESLDITSLPQAGSPAEESRRTMALQQLLSSAPPPGQNTVLVAHLFNIQRAADANLAEGEAAVFRPRGASGFELVATISSEEWDALANG